MAMAAQRRRLSNQRIPASSFESLFDDDRKQRSNTHLTSRAFWPLASPLPRMGMPAGWIVAVSLVLAGGGATALAWQWAVPPAAANASLLALGALAYALLSRRSGRPPLPLQARALIFYAWLLLNLVWFAAGLASRDLTKKPRWLKQTLLPSASQRFGEPTHAALRLSYGIGMAACQPLLANLAVLLLPVDRTLLLLGCLGAGHEDGVLAHALCGGAVWVWASLHALLTQAPMLAAGLWSVIALPPADGTETKGLKNFMGLLAWLLLCVMGVSSLAPFRRRLFNAFQFLHTYLFGAILLLGCLHDSKVFWYGMLGVLLYGADLAQRWTLRRRTAVATATLYPRATAFNAPTGAVAAAAVKAASQALTAAAPSSAEGSLATVTAAAVPARVAALCAEAAVKAAVAGGPCAEFVVLRVHTGGPPGCCAGQHVFVQVPRVSRWEWHPYSVAAHDDRSFAIVVKAGGDWERRLRRLVAVEAAAAGGGCCAQLEVVYEGLYGTPDLQAAAGAADRVLLFAGGAGITPIASVLQSLLLTQQQQSGWLQPHSQDCQVQQQQPRHSPVGNGGCAEQDGGCPRACNAHLSGSGAAINGGPHPSSADAAQLGGMDSHARRDWADPGERGAAVHPQGAGARSCGGARVRLVWAVTQESDAQAMQPLLSAAAQRGCAIELHCTRPHEPRACVHVHCGAATAAATAGAEPHAADRISHTATAAQTPNGGTATAPTPLHRARPTALTIPYGSTEPPVWQPRAAAPPWRLSGAACWAVVAAAAAAGAVGRTLGGALVSSHHCRVVAASLLAATGGSGGGGGDVVALARAAFLPPARQGAGSTGVGGWLGLLAGGGGAAANSCPAALAPGGGGGGEQGGEAVDVRVCRVWGSSSAPELCVKCDPFKRLSPAQQAWPCCSARLCFFGTHLAPLLGWVLGAAAGAWLVCLAWRLCWRRRQRRAAAVVQGVGEARSGWGLAGVRRARGNWLTDLRAGGGGGGGGVRQEVAAPLLCGHGDDVEAAAAAGTVAAAEEGGAVERLGIEAMVDALAGSGAAGLLCCEPCALGAGCCGEGGGAAAGGVRVCRGRPDVDAIVRAAAKDAAGCAGGGARGSVVYGVVVCGPESLQAAVRESYGRHLERAFPGSWLRGFSFTT